MAVEELSNPPGQRELAYRVRDYNSSIARMRSELSRFAIPSGPNNGSRPLSALTTRDFDDPSIALLDSCATVIDVLTFYQERIANEGYLATATERLSLVELTRAVGYELDPGVAAATHLAFEVEDTPGSPESVTVPAGTQVQSLPGQDELPQVFETSERITARATVQALRPRLTSPQRFTLNTSAGTGDQISRLVFRGAALNLVPGQLLYIPEAQKVVHVGAVQVDAASELTFVDLFNGETVQKLTNAEMLAQTPTGPSVLVFRQQVGLLGRWSIATDPTPIKTNSSDTTSTPIDPASLAGTTTSISNFDMLDASAQLTHVASITTRKVELGKSEAKITTTIDTTTTVKPSTGTPERRTPPDIYLERIVQGIVPSCMVVLVDPKDPSKTKGYKVTEVEDRVEIEQGVATPCSRLKLDGYSAPGVSCTATVHVLSEPLESIELADMLPIPDIRKGSVIDSNRKFVLEKEASDLHVHQMVVISGRTIDPPGAKALEVRRIGRIEHRNGTSTLTFTSALDNKYVDSSVTLSPEDWNRKVLLDDDASDLRVDQLVAISGQTIDPPGASAAEVRCIETIERINGRSTLIFTKPLDYPYVASSVVLNANVASATHGQTVSREVLGSGDGAQTNQVFFLMKPALTFVPAANSRGSVSTLKIWVNDVLWQEVPTLFGQNGRAQCYMLRIDEAGQVSVIFGDGVCGARLPTGMDNIVASYRTGLGCAGRLGANKLIIPLDRPLGIRSVYNPLPTTGGADAEPMEVARTLAPLSVRTLGRVVTLSDFQDFATSYPGVGKALVAEIEFNKEKIIQLTVIRPGGDTFEKNECEELERALLAVGDPTQVFRIVSGRTVYFGVGANLDIDPRQVAANVLAAATQALLDTFGFSARRFGQSVHVAQVVVTLQRVPGIQGVRLTRFALRGSTGVLPTLPVPVTEPLTKSTATDTTTGAELFLISPTDVILSQGGTL